MSDSDIRAANLAALQRAFVAIGKGDADAMMDNYTDDVSMEMPFAADPSIRRGNAEIRAYLREMFESFRFELTITEVHECLDPNQLVVEFTSNGTITTTGKPYANRYIALYWFRDGKVCAWREFFDPKIVDEATS